MGRFGACVLTHPTSQLLNFPTSQLAQLDSNRAVFRRVRSGSVRGVPSLIPHPVRELRSAPCQRPKEIRTSAKTQPRREAGRESARIFYGPAVDQGNLLPRTGVTVNGGGLPVKDLRAELPASAERHPNFPTPQLHNFPTLSKYDILFAN